MTERSAAGRFPHMDSIRAIAALMIFGYHSAIQFRLTGTAQDFAQTLTVGVPAFFVVSGFLLYRPFVLSHLRGEGGMAVGPYAWRRFLRIVPAFWVALTVYVVLGPAREPLGDLPWLYGFAQVYTPRTASAGIGQAWSLDCEIVYYALIPLVAMGVWSVAGGRARAWRSHMAALLALVAVAVAYKLWFFTWGDLRDPRDAIFTFHPGWNLDLFVAGMGVALWSAKREVEGGSDRVIDFVRRRAWVLWAAALASFVVTSLRAGDFRTELGTFELEILRVAFAVCLVLPAIYGSRAGVVHTALADRRLLALGVVSYAFYLYHQMWISLLIDVDVPGLSHSAGKAAMLPLAFAGTVATAAASWILIERPALSLKRLLPSPVPAR